MSFLVDSDSLLTSKVILLDFRIKVTWKEFDEDFISSSIKRDHTISINMLQAFRG